MLCMQYKKGYLSVWPDARRILNLRQQSLGLTCRVIEILCYHILGMSCVHDGIRLKDSCGSVDFMSRYASTRHAAMRPSQPDGAYGNLSSEQPNISIQQNGSFGHKTCGNGRLWSARRCVVFGDFECSVDAAMRPLQMQGFVTITSRGSLELFIADYSVAAIIAARRNALSRGSWIGDKVDGARRSIDLEICAV